MKTQNTLLSDFATVPVSNYLGETPVWSVTEQCLYWINCEKEAELHRWSPETSDHKVWPMPERIGGVALKQGGGVVVFLGSGLYDLDLESGRLALRAASPLPSHVKLHECATDRQGRLWVGAYDHDFTPDNRNPQGAAYMRLEGDKFVPEITHINIANGLAFSPDGKTIYVADSPSRQIFTYDLDTATGKLSSRKDFLTISPEVGFLDGATVDADGGYWLAVMYGNALHRYLPDGTLDYVINLPFSSPTKAVFGGPDLDTLFITTTQMRVGAAAPAGFERNGPVYSLKTNFKGIADTPMAF